jgi:hypothetical protein
MALRPPVRATRALVKIGEAEATVITMKMRITLSRILNHLITRSTRKVNMVFNRV